ncbi:MAG: hypothetical protein MJ172_09165 [Clostridia bacterium]|nr:hypothetical protein [Clostridia bacterium]
MALDSNMTYDNIKMLEITYGDLSGGGYKALFDFERQKIKWTDEYVWNNNFMKTLNDSKFELLCTNLASTEVIEWVNGYLDGREDEFGRSVPSLSQWKVKIIFNDDSKLEAEAVRHFPRKWNDFKHLIEDTTDCFLKLR